MPKQSKTTGFWRCFKAQRLRFLMSKRPVLLVAFKTSAPAWTTARRSRLQHLGLTCRNQNEDEKTNKLSKLNVITTKTKQTEQNMLNNQTKALKAHKQNDKKPLPTSSKHTKQKISKKNPQQNKIHTLYLSKTKKPTNKNHFQFISQFTQLLIFGNLTDGHSTVGRLCTAIVRDGTNEVGRLPHEALLLQRVLREEKCWMAGKKEANETVKAT